MNILALDISGSSTGWSFAEKGTLKKWGKFVSNLKHGRGQRLNEFGEFLFELFTQYNPDIILIEKPFLGRNSKVLANLSKFVAMAECQAFKALNLEIKDEWFIDPRKIKKLLKVKKPRARGRSAKDKHEDNKKMMVDRINSLYGMQLKYIKKKSKKYNDDDIADSIALLHAWFILQDEK